MTEKDYIKEYMKGGYTKSQAYLLAKNKMQQGGTTNGYANNQKPIARVLRNVETNEVKEGSLPPGYYTKIIYEDNSVDYIKKENEDMFYKMPNYIEFMKRQQQNNFAPNTQEGISMAEPTQSFQMGGFKGAYYTQPSNQAPIPNNFWMMPNQQMSPNDPFNPNYVAPTQQQEQDYITLSPEQLGETAPQSRPMVSTVNAGLTPAGLKMPPTLSESGQASAQRMSNAPRMASTPPNQTTDPQNQKMQLFNPYGGVGLDQSLYMSGQGFGSKNYAQGAGAGALALLSGTRNFLSGFSSAKATREEEEEQRRRQFEEQNNPIYLAQEGGKVTDEKYRKKEEEYKKKIKYDDKYPPIYLSDPNDPRIGFYSEKGNQWLYKESPQREKLKPLQNNLQPADLFRPNMQVEADSNLTPMAQIPREYLVETRGGGNFGGWTRNERVVDPNNMSVDDGNSRTITPIYQEGGEIVSNADILTGDYITEMPDQVNVEIEEDEVIKNAETGQIQKAVGETHENGGIKTNLPDGSQVLSDFTKIGKDNAKYIAEQYDVKVSATDTFAKAMDKINKKIGIDELSKEEADYIKVVEKQEGVDKATADINSQFLAEEIEKIQVKKESLKPIQDGAFQELFNRQEMIPKKGNSAEIMKEGGYSEDVLNFAKKYNLHPDKIITLMQEGGEVQQNQIVEAINEMLAQGMTPEQILEQLIAQGVPQEEAVQMVQAVVGQAQQEQAPMMEEGGTQGEEKMTAEQKKQKLEDYFKQYTALGYTGKKDIAEIQKWAAKNYPDDVVNYYIKSGQPANAKHVDIIKQKHKDVFKTTGIDPNKPSASYTSEEKKILTDALGENATKEFWLEGFQDGLYDWRLPAISQAQNTTGSGYKAEMTTPKMYPLAGSGQEAPTTPDDSTTPPTAQTNARGVKTMLPLLPQDLLLPPGALASIYKGEVDFGQLDPSKITPEPQLTEIERQRQSASNQAYFLPDAQRASVLAQMLGTSQGASNEAIGKAEMFNAQQRQVADQYNLQTQAKEDLTNIDLNKDYERRSLAGQAMYEQNLRRFLNKMNDVQRQNFADVRDLNLANAAFDQYQTDGSNIYFTNPATFTVPQASGISQEQYDAMTPDQRKAFKAMYTQQNS